MVKVLIRLTLVSMTLVIVNVQSGTSQTASSLLRLKTSAADRSELGAAPNNPWTVGGEIGYKFAGADDFADHLLVSGKIINEITLNARASRGWRLPVIANIASLAADIAQGKETDSIKAASQALLSTGQGMHAGVYPFRVYHRGSNLQGTVFFTALAKANRFAAQDTAKDPITLVQGRFSAGTEFAVGSSGVQPLTLSLAVTGAVFSKDAYKSAFGTSRSGFFGFEATAILPLQQGMGFIAEAVTAQHTKPAVRIGLVVIPKNDGGGQTPAPPADRFLLNIHVEGNGSGAVVSEPAGINCTITAGNTQNCSANFAKDQQVTLKVTPATGSAVTAWDQPACLGAALTCAVKVTDVTTVTLTIKQN